MTVDQDGLARWKWYCRIDGEEGEYGSPAERDSAALKHRDSECSTARRLHKEWAEFGFLVHVWSY